MGMKSDAKEIFKYALESVLPKNFIKESLSLKDGILKIQNDSYDLKKYKNIYLFGSGKASITMAQELENILKNLLKGGVIVSNYTKNLKYVKTLLSTHPLPSKKSQIAANTLLKEFQKMKKDDFFIYLLSGGSSAMIEKPISPISMEDFIKMTKLLLKNSIPINEINIVRKQISAIKGGALARATKANGIVLVMSDVVGNDLNSIASAPLYDDNLTKKDALWILEKYNLLNKTPESIKKVLYQSSRDTKPKKDIKHYIIADNYLALKNAQKKAKELGYDTVVYKDFLKDNVQVAAKKIFDVVKNSNKQCLIFGGESTVEVVGDGKGGRNQELALWFLKEIKDDQSIIFLSGASDGVDGNSDASGAVVSCDDFDKEIDKFLKNSDSNSYLKKKSALLKGYNSGTNVMDISIVLKH